MKRTQLGNWDFTTGSSQPIKPHSSRFPYFYSYCFSVYFQILIVQQLINRFSRITAKTTPNYTQIIPKSSNKQRFPQKQPQPEHTQYSDSTNFSFALPCSCQDANKVTANTITEDGITAGVTTAKKLFTK